MTLDDKILLQSWEHSCYNTRFFEQIVWVKCPHQEPTAQREGEGSSILLTKVVIDIEYDVEIDAKIIQWIHK